MGCRGLIAVVLTVAVLLAACASTSAPPEELLPPGAERQAQLTVLYDRFASSNDKAGEAAASEAARCDTRDRRFLSSLWGTRSTEETGARRYAAALSVEGLHDEAYLWYERAFLNLPKGHQLRPWLRYDMAFELLALGRPDDAIEVLTNRFELEPLPAALEQRYDELLDRALKAAGNG